jgi:hypothetical protein
MKQGDLHLVNYKLLIKLLLLMKTNKKLKGR